MDDDDDFLYGGAPGQPSQPPPASELEPASYNDVRTTQFGIAHLEEEAESPPVERQVEDVGANEEVDLGEEEEEEDEEEEEEEDDIEIIMEPVSRSLDLRNQNRPPPSRPPPSSSTPSQPKATQPSLTTEYTPIQRGGQAPTTSTLPELETPSRQAAQAPSTTPSHPPAGQLSQELDGSIPNDGIDTSTLPPARAPPSQPSISPDATGMFDSISILEYDLNAMVDKPWRRPGSDISDWFNYGFDEISWEAYCYRRRDLGDLANVLKTNVINFAAMTEDQLTALPGDVRTMVMTGATAMMNNATANTGMMGPGVMMDMSMMGPMGMGMNGDMGMGNAMMQGMMQDGGQGQQGGVVAPNGGSEQGVGMMQDGFNPNAGGMMNMAMGNDFGMQDQNSMVQQMYPVMETQNVPAVSSGRGTPVPFRGRGAPMNRGRGFIGRGRGRGGIYGSDVPPPVPIRPASPLPPGVPTGPRNQNKYKDRDGNAPAVDGLDYGGGKEGLGRRTPTVEPEDRVSSRKRRSSPGLDEVRSSKRR